jgi:hypothetical protein
MEEEKSRIEAKAERDAVLRAGFGDYWDKLWVAIEATVQRVQRLWNIDLSSRLNDANTLIRVSAPAFMDSRQINPTTPYLEIRADHQRRVLIVRFPHKSESGTPYQATLDSATKTVSVHGKTPLALAEHLIAERLLGKNLD